MYLGRLVVLRAADGGWPLSFPACSISWPGVPTPVSLGRISAEPHICPIPIPAASVSPLCLHLQFVLVLPEDRSGLSLHALAAPGTMGPWSQICPQVTTVRDTNTGHGAIHSLGLLGGELARFADVNQFAEVPCGLHELLFLANSARRRVERHLGTARWSVWMRTSGCRTAATATPANAPQRWRAAGCRPASTSGSPGSGRR